MPCGPHWRAADFASARTPSTAVVARDESAGAGEAGRRRDEHDAPRAGRREPGVGGLERDDRVADEGLGPCVPLGGRGVDEGLQRSPASSRHTCTTASRRGVAANAASAADRSAKAWAVVATSTPDATEGVGELLAERGRGVGHEHRQTVEHAGMVGHGPMGGFELGVRRHDRRRGRGGRWRHRCGGVVDAASTRARSVLGIDVDAERLALTANALGSAASRFHGVLADATDARAIDDGSHDRRGDAASVARAGARRRGDVDGAVVRRSPTSRRETFAAVVDLNLQSAFVTTQAVARRLVDQGSGGSIVHISSISALAAMPFGAPYAAAKAGLLALVRTAAVELGCSGVRGSTRSRRARCARRRPNAAA